MMQSGFRDQNGERLAGLRELMEKLRRRRKDELEKYDLGGVYDAIAQELREVVDQERQGVDQLEQEARESGDQRREEITTQVAQEKRMQLDLLPPDLAGQVRELSEYEFTSSEARERFDELMDKLRQQLMQSYFNQMSGALQNVSPEQMQRMKDMLSALNQMLEQRANGQEPDFESFMQQYGDFFPGNPQTLDELLEQMAEQMAAMQAMLNSITPEPRAQRHGARPPRRGRGPRPRTPGRAGQDARGGGTHRAEGGALRADSEGHAQDRPERAGRPVRQAQSGPHRPPPARAVGRGP